MTYYLPPELAAMIAANYGDPPVSRNQSNQVEDPAWEDWQEIIKEYRGETNSGVLPKLNFWLVISLPGGDYSDKIEWHEKTPMLVPSPGTGTLLGIAKSRAELDEMLCEDSESKNGKPGNVHLVYKVKIQGKKAWRDLIEFLADHDCLEKE